jgi:hypothetical protein
MRKSYAVLLFSILLFFLPICKANFSINPREISIIMEDDFIQGNTSKMVIVTNNIEESINISWYMDNPTQDKIRENKTLIPSLSWISITPQWKIIPPNGSTMFYIYLDIPKDKENLNQNWEIWPVFKQEETQFINLEHALRLYIDTPEIFPNEKNENKNQPSIIYENSIIFVIIAIIFIVVAISLYILKTKNNKS